MLALLESLDADFLAACECYFGGGTAVALRCGEPRVSHDVDFLCANQNGYRALRERVFGRGAGALFRSDVDAVRELRADRYGIRTAIRVGDAVIKLELVSEGRVELAGTVDPDLPVRRLCDVDLVTEKLLANADRGLDDFSLGRDMIDLMMLEDVLGALPEVAFAKARGAYGNSVDRAFDLVRAKLREDAAFRLRCFEGLGLAPYARVIVERRITSPTRPA